MKTLLYFTSLLWLISIAAFSQPTLSLSSVQGWQGGTIAVDLRLTGGTESYGGFNATIELPNGFRLLRVLNGDLLPAGGFFIDQQSAVLPGPNEFSILAYSPSNSFTGSGVLVSVLLQIPSSAPLGTNVISFKGSSNSFLSAHALASSDGLRSVDHSVSAGMVDVYNPYADSDGDGYSDMVEIAFGTNPHDRNSKPTPSLIRGPNGLSLQFPSSSDRVFTYKVITTDQLSQPVDFSTWSIVADALRGTSAGISLTNLGNPAQHRYFQIIVEVAQ